MGPELPPGGPALSAILPQSGTRFRVRVSRVSAAEGDETMAKNIIRIATNEKLTRAAHWTVFSIGLLSLTFSIAATAASAL